ncbi:MAG: hypothetical protein U0271_18080 [Polyangiaceae bacterium]
MSRSGIARGGRTALARWFARSALLGSTTMVVAAAFGGCLDRPIKVQDPRETRTVNEVVPVGRVDKIDLLLAIDNSISMKDKQVILGDAVPELVRRFVNPRCLDPSPNPISWKQIELEHPYSASGECPLIDKDGAQVQTEREFRPITDIHVGLISSSLGALGGGLCPNTPPNNDFAHLLTRDDAGGVVPSFEDKGFLAWGGEGGDTDVTSFQSKLKDMVLGVGQDGCGFEMQLESVVRFLVDPKPYKTVQHTGGGAVPDNVEVDVDQEILDQRADFLRPDSLVAVIMLSDENDCSVQATGPAWAVIDGKIKRGTSICETNPDDKCCYSCSEKNPPAECSHDPVCDVSPPLEITSPNLRCWDQKRRFGEDFLYPVQRYVNAFTLDRIDRAKRDLVPESPDDGEENPLLKGRSAGLVYFAGIVGVPWQAIARKDTSNQPDISRGYMTTAELEKAGLFEQLVGDPDNHVRPTDPFMVESLEKRPGSSSLLGADPNEPGNPINMGDRTPETSPLNMQLQYACTFDIDDKPGGPDCGSCTDASCDNPVCNGTVQTHAKALPGLRQLAVVRGMGEQGIAASVCPAEIDPNADEYGYAPAVGSIIDALKEDLKGIQCLPFPLAVEEDTKQVSCLVIESSKDDVCDCEARAGHFTPPEEHERAVDEIKKQSTEHNCFCEVQQLEGDSLDTCLNDDPVPPGVDGWCYVDPTIGSSDLVSECPPAERHIIRPVGDGLPTGGALHIYCTNEANPDQAVE